MAIWRRKSVDERENLPNGGHECVDDRRLMYRCSSRMETGHFGPVGTYHKVLALGSTCHATEDSEIPIWKRMHSRAGSSAAQTTWYSRWLLDKLEAKVGTGSARARGNRCLFHKIPASHLDPGIRHRKGYITAWSRRLRSQPHRLLGQYTCLAHARLGHRHERRYIIALQTPHPVSPLSTDRVQCLERIECCSADVGLSKRRRVRRETPGQAEETTGFRCLLVLPNA